MSSVETTNDVKCQMAVPLGTVSSPATRALITKPYFSYTTLPHSRSVTQVLYLVLLRHNEDFIVDRGDASNPC